MARDDESDVFVDVDLFFQTLAYSKCLAEAAGTWLLREGFGATHISKGLRTLNQADFLGTSDSERIRWISMDFQGSYTVPMAGTIYWSTFG